MTNPGDGSGRGREEVENRWARGRPELLEVGVACAGDHPQVRVRDSLDAGVVTGYEDPAIGTMRQDDSGGGTFTDIVLRPRVELSAGDVDPANQLHGDVGYYYFVARSVAVPIRHQPTTALAA